MGYKLIEEKYLTEAEVKELLKKIDKKEMTEEQKKAMEHVESVKLSLKKVKELEEKLKELKINKLKPKFIVKIIDFLPQTYDDLKVILQTSSVAFNKEEIEKILEVVKENANN